MQTNPSFQKLRLKQSAVNIMRLSNPFGLHSPNDEAKNVSLLEAELESPPSVPGSQGQSIEVLSMRMMIRQIGSTSQNPRKSTVFVLLPSSFY